MNQKFSLNDHESSILNLIHIHNEKKSLIASASSDKTIKLWELNYKYNLKKIMKMIFILKKKMLPILNKKYILSVVSKYLMIEGACIHTLIGHKKNIYALSQLDSNTLISSGADQTIKFWDMYKGVCINTIELNYSNLLNLLVINSNKIIITYGKGVLIYNTLNKSLSQIKAFEVFDIMALIKIREKSNSFVWCHANDIGIYNTTTATNYHITVNGYFSIKSITQLNHTIFGEDQIILALGLSVWDKEIVIVNMTSKEILKSITTNSCVWGLYSFTSLITSKSYFLSGDDNGIIVLYDQENFEKIVEIKAHYGRINSVVVINNTTVVTTGDDGIIKIWEIQNFI